MQHQIEWLKQIDKVHKGTSVVCPQCGSTNVKCAFFRFPDGVGHGDMKCEDCGSMAHISRMKFPENTKAAITDL